MEFIEKGIPLWKITIWDKRFNNVDNEWQPKTIKYNYLLSDELNSIKSEDGDVRILYTGKEVGYTTEELAGQNLSEGEIVSIPWGGIPSVKYHKGKFVTGDNRIATSSDVNRLTNKYLYYFLRGNIHEVASYYRGASLKHPNMKDILKMKISFPSIDIQEKICTQLDILESIIALRQKELLELDKLIRARFVELFGDIKNTESKFKTRKLGEVAIIGSSHRVFTTEFVDKGIPFYRGTEISDLSKGIKPNCMYYISEEHYNRISSDNTKPKIGDLLMPSICNKGQVWMVDTDEPFYYKDGRVLCISPNRDIFNTRYLEHFMKEKTQEEYAKLGSGSTFAEFKIFLLKDIDILVPPIGLQNDFATFVEQVNKSKLLAASQPQIHIYKTLTLL
ncbi:MAG: restriction endonuclease subunit S [Lachnospiraceae bacterium]|nr:restriction endonuclease subunit S [Lachnospiraceae bacterium]